MEKNGVSIIDSIPLCTNVKALKRGTNQEICLLFYIEVKIGLSIIDSIPYCHTENALKKDKNQLSLLRF